MMQQVYQHYRREEHHFIDQCIDWIQQVSRRYMPYLTDFLTPREQTILQAINGSYEEINVLFFGGFDNAERQRGLIYPYYESPSAEDFAINVLQIDYHQKFASLTHGQILGTLMSTGIERQLIGDIITDGSRWQVICNQTIADFLINQIDRINRAGINIHKVELSDVLEPIAEWRDRQVISSSLRLDTLIANVYNLSRQRSKELIERKLVQVNFTIENQPNFELGIADIVSVRRQGRFWINEVEGITRKNNYRLNISTLKR